MTTFVHVLPDATIDMAIAEGTAVGRSRISQFGHNPDVADDTTEDVINTGGLWVPPASQEIHSLVSTSAADVGPCPVRYLPDWDKKALTEIVQLNGLTPVPMANASVALQQLFFPGNVGTITASGSVTVLAITTILPGIGVSSQAVVTLPSIQSLNVVTIDISLNKTGNPITGGSDFHLSTNQTPETDLTKFYQSVPEGLAVTGTSSRTLPFPLPFPIAGPAIVKMQATAIGADFNVTGGMLGYLKDN